MQNIEYTLAKKELFKIGILTGFLLLSLGVSKLLLNYLSLSPVLDFPSRVFSLEIQPEPVKIAEFTLYPQRIQIPSAGIDALVSEGGIVDGEWILSPQSAYFLPKTFISPDQSNTIIYAHKRVGLFINLGKVNQGDEITVLDKFNHPYTYKVVQTLTADPNDLESLRVEGKNMLTLITCDGIFDKERLIVKAEIAGT